MKTFVVVAAILSLVRAAPAYSQTFMMAAADSGGDSTGVSVPAGAVAGAAASAAAGAVPVKDFGMKITGYPYA